MEIQQDKVRLKLEPRREPYWRHLERGLSLGFRKSATGGTWVARWRDPDIGPGRKTRKQHYKPLGSVQDVSYAAAAAEATRWRGQAEAGVVKSQTVADALRDYVENIKVEKGPGPAKDAEDYFKKLVYGDDAPLWGRRFGSLRLDKVQDTHVEKFRNAVVEGRKPATVNRIMTRFEAALNRKYKAGKTLTAPWKGVKSLSTGGDEGEQRVYLEKEHRRAILAECSPALADFLVGILYTAARPGDLARANVGDLNKRDKTLRLVTRKGKGEPRVYKAELTDEGFELFARHADKRGRKEPLLTNAEGRGWQKKHWGQKLRQAAAAAKEKGAELPEGIVAYCFRHSAITDWVRSKEQGGAGMNIGDVAKLSGTSMKEIDKHYYKQGETRSARASVSVV